MKNFRLLRLKFLLFGLFASVISIMAQTVSGTVKDDTGEPIVGATVIVKGSNPLVGTATDIDGNFTIKAGPNDELEIKMMSYQTRKVKVGNNTVIPVVMKTASQELETVVKIGYGQVKKSDATGSVAVVSKEELTKIPAASFDKALQGRAAGVMVSSTSGAPGSGPTIKIRGVGSINKGSEPLYVIDGNTVDNSSSVGGMNPLSSIAPEDIENISILKDASATAIYGARGANGVVIITTKRGQSGDKKTQVSFSAFTGFSAFPKQLPIMNGDKYANYIRALHSAENSENPYDPTFVSDAVRDANAQTEWYNGNGRINTDWQKLLTRSHAPLKSYNMSITGGGANSSFSLGGNYYKEEGTLVNTNAERYGLRLNSDFKLSEWVKVGQSLNVNNANSLNVRDPFNQNSASSISLGTALTANPLMPVYNKNNIGGFQGPEPRYNGINDVSNPMASAMLNNLNSKGTRMLSDIYAEISPTFIKGLKYKFDFGYDLITNNTFNFNPIYELPSLGTRSHLVNELNQGNSLTTMWKINNMLTYTTAFGPEDEESKAKPHNITVMVGQERLVHRRESFGAAGQGFMDERYRVLNNAEIALPPSGSNNEYRMASYLGRLLYDYKSKYLFTMNIRNDWSTVFGPLNRSGVFPSFSGAWKFNEDFLQDYRDIISLGKLRIGWGQTGNCNIDPFTYADHFDPAKNAQYPFGGNTIDPRRLYGTILYESGSNPKLKWEATSMTNFGLDVALFENKIQFTAEYYIKNQHDMLVKDAMPYAYGRLPGASDPWVNLGDIQNRGLELNLTYSKKEGDFNYNVSGNFTTIKNKVISLPNGDILNDNVTITSPGHTIGSFYGFVAEGIFQTQQEVDDWAIQEQKTQPGDIKYKDLNGDRKINAEDRTIIGKPIPDFIYGLNFDCSWKGFDFSIFFQGVQNVDIYNSTRSLMMGPANFNDGNRFEDIMNYWTPENRSTTNLRLDLKDGNNNARTSSFWLEDGSFLRLKNLQLGYTLPKSVLEKIKISRIRVYISGTNIYTITKYKGYDPEIANQSPLKANFDNSYYPVPRVYTAGVQVEF